MAGKFGADATVDAYALAFMLPDLLFFAIAGGALSSAFIPVFSEYLHTDREDDAWHVFSSVVTIMSTIVLLFIAVAFVFAEPLTRLLAGGKSNELMPLIVEMTRILLPAQFAFFIGGLMFGTLYARQVFAVPGLGPNVYNIGIILGAVVISQFVSPGIKGMAWGALAGAVIGNLVLPLLVMNRLGARYRVQYDVRHPGVKKVFVLMAPVVFGLSLPGVYDMITRYFGTFFADGVNAWLRYGNLLMQAPLGIFGQSLAIAVFPALAQFYAQQRMDMFRQQLSATIRTTLFLTLPVSVLFAVAAPQIVAALYQQGRFTSADTQAVGEILRWFSIGIWAWCLQPVLMRGFFAIQATVPPIILGTVTTAVFVALIWLLKPLQGYLAIPMASSTAAILLAGALLVAIQQRVGTLDVAGIGTTFAKSLLASACFGAISYLVLLSPLNAPGLGKLVAVLLLLACTVPGAVVYFLVTRRLQMPESETISRAMNRLSRKAGRNAKG